MRYAIFSDVHSNLEALQAVISAYKKEGIDKYFCIGDVVGYAANPNECVELVRQLAAVTVAGNHDWAGVGLFSTDYFNPKAKEALLWTTKKLNDSSSHFLQSLRLLHQEPDFTLAHGTLNEPQEFFYLTDGYIAEDSFKLLENNLCFVGHTHTPGVFIKEKYGSIRYTQEGVFSINPDSKYIVNAGSVGQPRDRDPRAAYCIYDSGKKEVCIKRIDYDIEKAREKLINNGLPAFFGDRLLAGR